ncbi:MAG: phage holin family protein [bacterium]|nr:phage holin family protein [bacterium]
MNIIVYLILNTLAVLAASYVLPGVHVSGVWQAVMVALIFGVVMTVIRPILLALTLPLNIVTLGLFTFVINALLVLFVSNIVPGFRVDSFWWALGFSIVVSVINGFLYTALPPRSPKIHV